MKPQTRPLALTPSPTDGGGTKANAGVGSSPRAGERPGEGFHRRRWLTFGGYFLLLAVITGGAYLGLVPTKLEAIPFSDKLGHFVLIGGAALLLDQAWQRRTRIRLPGLGWWAVPTAAFAIFATAFVDETAQLLSPIRTFDLLDIGADLLGIVALCWTGGLVLSRLTRRAG